MICPPCVRVDCENQPDIELYSLQSGILFGNALLSFVVSCPIGYVCTPGTFPRTITYPPNRWTITIPTNAPAGYILRLTGCSSEVVRIVPAGATAAQIAVLANQIIAEVAAQQSQCDAILLTVPPPVPQPFSNQTVYFVHACGAGEGLQYSGNLPSWITLDTPNNRLVVNPGFFTGETQAAANLSAQTALNNFGNAALTAGTLFCQSIACCNDFLAQQFTISDYAPGSFQTHQTVDVNGSAGSGNIFIDDFGDPLVVTLFSFGASPSGWFLNGGAWFRCPGGNSSVPRSRIDSCFGNYAGGDYSNFAEPLIAFTFTTNYPFPAWDGVFEILPDSGNCSVETLSTDVGCVVGPPTPTTTAGVTFSISCEVSGLNIIWTLRFTGASGGILLWEGQQTNPSPDGVFTRTAGESATPASLTVV